MCSRNDDPTQIDPPYKWPEKERDRFVTTMDYPPTAKTEEELEEKLLVQPYNCGPELLARSIHSCSFPYSGPYCPVHEAWVNYLNA